MPNVEIHGYGTGGIAPGALKERIWKLCEDDPDTKPYTKEMVVTIVSSVTTDAHDIHQPFLRLLSSDPKEAEDILRVLEKGINIDIEYLKIERFIPKKSGT